MSAFILLLSFLACVALASEGDIKANRGGEAILQCLGPRDAAVVLLRWMRPDLGSDKYVFYFRQNHINEEYQHESFHGRVKLRDPTMKDGDVSVVLKDVDINDAGTYECYVGTMERSPELINNLTLKVEPVQTNVTAAPGQTVPLTCEAPVTMDVTAVKWIRPDLEPDSVILYQEGQTDPEDQHPSFQNRVELKDKQMKDGDVSVILKNVTFNDTGTYECHVVQRGTSRKKRNSLDTRPICIIHLTVQPRHEEIEGDNNVKTPDGDTNDEKRNKVGLVVGVCLLVVVAVLLVVGGFIYKKRRNQNSHQQPAQQTHELEPFRNGSAAESSAAADTQR